MMLPVLHILFILLFVFSAVCILYLLIAAIAGHFRKKMTYLPSIHKKRIAVLITSYKEDEVIVQTALRASAHNYDPAYFDVFLAAQALQSETLLALNRLRVNLSVVDFKNGSKAKSLNYLLNNIDEENYEIAVVLDGDNIMEDGFLEKVDTAFNNGLRAVQGHRTAKNRNTPVAMLDAVSEEINNHLFRKAQRAMSLSAATIGSGMAFEFRKLKEVYNKPGILDNPACDREVDFEMMKAGITVEYLDNARILDEKVSRAHVYEKQRRRWMESQIIHLRLFFSGKERVAHKTKDYWNKLFINLIPPRIIFIALFGFIFCICLLQNIFHFHILEPPARAWSALFIAYTVSMLLSIPKHLYTVKTVRAFLYIPILLFSFLKAAFSLKPARKEFIHTPKEFRDE